MNLTPPADRVLIRQCEPEAETAFGLALPETAQEKPMRGIVVAVGEGTPDPLRPGVRIPLGIYRAGGTAGPARGMLGQLMPGDEVVMPKWGGTSLEFDGDEYVSILASELLAVVTA